MAGTPSEYHRGDMDIHAQQSTFRAVMVASKWSCLALAAGITFFTLLFCTTAGFFSAFITAVIIIALGVAFLRERPASH
jgi:hypothetical protein